MKYFPLTLCTRWFRPASPSLGGCAQGATLYVLPGNGNGTLGAEEDYPTGNLPLDTVIGDFNGDGKPDIVVFNSYSNSFIVLLNVGAGRLAPAVNCRTDLPFLSLNGHVFGGDLNGDKRTDVTIVVEDRVTTITAQPGGTSHTALSAEFFAFPNTLAPPIDLNRDGIPDLLAVASDFSCRDNSVLGELDPLISSNGIPFKEFVKVSDLENFDFSGMGIGDFRYFKLQTSTEMVRRTLSYQVPLVQR
jgi:FG-GAP-like repeat